MSRKKRVDPPLEVKNEHVESAQKPKEGLLETAYSVVHRIDQLAEHTKEQVHMLRNEAAELEMTVVTLQNIVVRMRNRANEIERALAK
jgi:predicted nuclease with TOPRIM domain